MNISKEGLDLIKSFEGLALESYRCPAGKWTVGYGHTKTAQPGMKITEAEAERLLREDVAEFEQTVRRAVKRPLQQPEFDALVSLAFNIGPRNFRNSTVLARINAGASRESVAEAWRWWNKAKGATLPGLIKRRAAEIELFMRAGEKPGFWPALLKIIGKILRRT